MLAHRLRGLVFGAISIATHAALVAGASRPRPAPPVARTFAIPAALQASRVVRMARIAAQRAVLVASARADIRAGRLALGEFLLAANALDAEERGAPFDLETARKLYHARVDALREALLREAPRLAVPEVMGDLRYFGRPGGLMAEALLEGGGSCEQISHLVAAAAYDGGAADRVALRYYGGAMDGGAAHLTAVELAGAEEHDLLLGRPAVRKGTRFAPTDLVEAYARVHGLAPPLPAPSARPSPASSTRDLAAEPGRPSLSAGYPPNDDRFPGTLPLFAARAVADPADDEAMAAAMAEASALEQRSRAHDCAFFVHMAALDPPRLDVDPGEGRRSFSVELRKVPGPDELERKAALLRGAEDIAADDADPADRMMAYACLTALARDIAEDFAAAGEHRLAELAVHKGHDASLKGAAAVAAVPWDAPAGAAAERRLSERFAGQTWLLLFLEGGDGVVLRLARTAPQPGASDWGRAEELASLVVAPATRAKAYAILDGLPRRTQVDVMHEVFRAHEHLRPWASSYTLDEDGAPRGRMFRRAYRVFRALAARFWERQIPPEQILPALVRESREAGLDPEWEALLLEYYGKNVIALYRSRAPAPGVMRLLSQAVEENHHPALDAFRRMLGEDPGGRSAERPVL